MSPRPRKQRRCDGKLCGKAFKPTGTPLADLPQITLLRDELKVLRLCDYAGLNQEEAGKKIGVSRGTVQRTLASAHKKVAEALSQGAALIFKDEDQSPFPIMKEKP